MLRPLVSPITQTLTYRSTHSIHRKLDQHQESRFHLPFPLSAVLYTCMSHILNCLQFASGFLVVHARPRFEENVKWKTFTLRPLSNKDNMPNCHTARRDTFVREIRWAYNREWTGNLRTSP